MSEAAEALERRVLMRAATARDALMTRAVLERAGVPVLNCTTLAALADELARGAGALVLAEEALADPAATGLTQALQRQPPWSDLPVLVLARQGADSRVVAEAMDSVANVTVIERPMRVAAFVSSVRSALRARNRQYDLRATLEGLRLADQRKTEFLATLAHELRNPLAPLQTALTLLKRKRPGPDEAVRHYDMMRRQIDHMVRLVNDLMEISRITRGKIEPDMDAIDLRQVLHDALELSRPLLDAAQHQLVLRLPDSPLPLEGDSVRLTQVFSNLLNNAAKYTPAGGHVALTAQAMDGQAIVSVQDDGIGIAPEMLDTVFDMFVQASGASKAAQGGLGIGLTLARSLVELHGGHIVAHSAGLGQGSTFTVRLPLQAAQAMETPVDALAAPSVALTALVVDDNRDAADSLAEFLQAIGMATAVAYSGDQALDLLPGLRPDLAILDIGMPGMDGYELARRLRRHPAGRDALLVALTGWGQERDREATAQAGFDHHLVKPLDPEQLIALVEGFSR
ncbi:ATP-binding protein [Pseudorhodoferax sp. Leaf265]|uniref:hybrid sensor histidine kinase/response regulator n=1 Tax=Pseudorhodoferax sp. Leaf265 TaxID=1736315 RepID=UPI0006F5C5DC|nr:ATP-binding protein [Pseudorhodoferax sp. Leaf265]KQP18746.1 histidine kinase [Pseudorhodoferax sp. Leaf265]